MHKLIVILFLFFLFSSAQAEETITRASDPVAISRTGPHYPRSEKKARHEGASKIKLVVTAAGKPEQVEIYRTSGWPLLDKEAIKAVRKWKFIPAHDRDGEAIAFTVFVSLQCDLSADN